VILVAVAVLVPIALLATSGGSKEADTNTSAVDSESEIYQVENQSDSPLWTAVLEEKALAFKGVYSGEPFDGEFKSYDAKLYFDPQNPEDGVFDVVINTASVTTYTSDWDSTIIGSEWFFIEQFPKAYYTASEFETTESGFIAKGELAIKGIRKPVDLPFTWEVTDSDTVAFKATALVPRVDFEIGSGTWAEDDSIGFTVDININMTLKSGQ
jgi:polyisoprenoid-binding protein YceI